MAIEQWVSRALFAARWIPHRHLGGSGGGVWWGQRRQRQAVLKVRHSHHGFRTQKEVSWLIQARALGLRVPSVIETRDDTGAIIVAMTGLSPCHGQWSPRELLERLAPLHGCATPSGWGPLRADRQPRWSDPDQALAWYLTQTHTADLQDLLRSTWQYRVAGIIHGDLHRGNIVGNSIIDWEAVAVADPWEDAARLALAHPRPAPWRWVGANADNPRWLGAWWRSAVEAAAHRGPRQAHATACLQYYLR